MTVQMKVLGYFSIVFLTLFSITSPAAEINYDNFQGTYRMEAKAFNKSAVIILVVRAGQVFEVTREYEDGHLGQTCDGKYTLNKVSQVESFGQDTVMMGQNVSCPDDRQKTYNIELNLKNAQTRDLDRGTYADLYSSDAKMTVMVKLKRQ